MRVIPPASNRRVAGSNVASDAVSCVALSSSVRISCRMRNVPCSQLTMEKSPRGVRSRNSTTSSPGWKRGMPATLEVRSPALPPSSRTLICAGAAPRHTSSTLESRERPDFPGVPARGIRLALRRERLPAPRATFARRTSARALSPPPWLPAPRAMARTAALSTRRARNCNLECASSLHLQHSRSHGAIVVGRRDEERPQARKRCARNLQIELDHVGEKSRHGRGRDADVAAARRAARAP